MSTMLKLSAVNNVTGLELDGQPVGMHGYFPDPVPYLSLIKLSELCALTSDEFHESSGRTIQQEGRERSLAKVSCPKMSGMAL